MSLDLREWLSIGHILGFVLWIGGLISVLHLLGAHSAVDAAARAVLSRQQRKAAMLMDMGATLTLVCGLWRAIGSIPNQFTTGAWLHIKVTLVVVVLLGIHGYARVKIRKFRNGEVKAIPASLPYVVVVVAAVIIVLGAKKDLLRKHAATIPAAVAPTN
jgi:protoporphyrinogen IX oxidase